jgi:rhodanese-related sulfurtransferase
VSSTVEDLVAAARRQIREITVDEAKARIAHLRVLDVREPAEFAAGSLPGAINVPRGVLEFQIDTIDAFKDDKDDAFLVYCHTGGRSALAAEVLQKLGYRQPLNLAGGFSAWKAACGAVTLPQ